MKNIWPLNRSTQRLLHFSLFNCIEAHWMQHWIDSFEPMNIEFSFKSIHLTRISCFFPHAFHVFLLQSFLYTATSTQKWNMNACGDMAFAFAQIDIWCINALHSFLLYCNSSSLFSSDMKKYWKMKAQNVYRIINVIYNTFTNGMQPLGWKERANRAHKTVLSVIEFVGKKITTSIVSLQSGICVLNVQ